VMPMRVFQVEEAWSMANVRLSTRPEPVPGRGQVRLRMLASALNYRDLMIPARGYGSKQDTLPLILLGDGVGIVESIGEAVTRVAIGDRVCPLFAQGWIGGEPDDDKLWHTLGCERDGTMAEFMVLPEDTVAHVPVHLDDTEAATLPCAGVTAWRALVSEGGVKAGDKVLVQGTGGVSMFALQFAKALGAFVIVTSSSDEKLAHALSMGADAGINYRTTPQWGKHARELAGGGVDHVVEVGGQQTLPQSLRAIRAGGSISMIGVLSGGSMETRLGPIVTRHIRLQGITLGSRDDFRAMTRAISHHKLRPVIDRVFEFDALREAFDHLAQGTHFGKICIRH
jgi:NADPH:quinone reductase-like Zn-dependent oxidoreductase